MVKVSDVNLMLANADASFAASRYADATAQYRQALESAQSAKLGPEVLHDIGFFIAKSMMLSGAEHAALLSFSENKAAFERLSPADREKRHEYEIDRWFCEGVILQNRNRVAESAERYRLVLDQQNANNAARINLCYLISLAPEKALGDLTPVLFSTLPRSGTWYSYHVFEFLERSLGAAPETYVPGELGIATLVFPRLNLYKGHLHALCPGFRASYDGPLRSKWEALAENTPNEYYSVDGQCYDPTLWSQTRIIYLYRNPLDQLSSHFSLKKRLRSEERDWSNVDPAEFVRGPEGIRQFILQYVTFAVMRRIKPENVMFFRYEDLMRDPLREYEAMLRFLDIEPDGQMRDHLRRAIAASSISEMQALEDKGKPISGVPLQEGASHLDGGAMGRWRKTFDESSVTYVREALAEFDIDLDALMREAGSPLA